MATTFGKAERDDNEMACKQEDSETFIPQGPSRWPASKISTFSEIRLAEQVRASSKLDKLNRVVPYLPCRGVAPKEPHCQRINVFQAMFQYLSGKFLHVGRTHEKNLKDSIFRENKNMAMVFSVLLSIWVPMTMEFTSDVTTKQHQQTEPSVVASPLAKAIGKDCIANGSNILADIMHMSYYWATCIMFLGMMMSVLIMLAAKELFDDRVVGHFIRTQGWLVHIPYICFLTGFTIWSIGLTLRFLFTTSSGMAFFVVEVTVLTALAAFSIASLLIHIMFLHITVHESSRYHGLVLSQAEADDDVIMYFENTLEEDLSIKGCLLDLSSKTNEGYIVALGSLSQYRVHCAYKQRFARLLGVNLSKDSIMQGIVERL